VSEISPIITILHEDCILCQKCVRSCPAEILIFQKEKNTSKGTIQITNPRECFECRACEVVCPVDAIKVNCDFSQVQEKNLVS